MQKVTFPDKQNAVDPANPSALEQVNAQNINELKDTLNANADEVDALVNGDTLVDGFVLANTHKGHTLKHILPGDITISVPDGLSTDMKFALMVSPQAGSLKIAWGSNISIVGFPKPLDLLKSRSPVLPGLAAFFCTGLVNEYTELAGELQDSAPIVKTPIDIFDTALLFEGGDPADPANFSVATGVATYVNLVTDELPDLSSNGYGAPVADVNGWINFDGVDDGMFMIPASPFPAAGVFILAKILDVITSPDADPPLQNFFCFTDPLTNNEVAANFDENRDEVYVRNSVNSYRRDWNPRVWPIGKIVMMHLWWENGHQYLEVSDLSQAAYNRQPDLDSGSIILEKFTATASPPQFMIGMEQRGGGAAADYFLPGQITRPILVSAEATLQQKKDMFTFYKSLAIT